MEEASVLEASVLVVDSVQQIIEPPIIADAEVAIAQPTKRPRSVTEKKGPKRKRF